MKYIRFFVAVIILLVIVGINSSYNTINTMTASTQTNRNSSTVSTPVEANSTLVSVEVGKIYVSTCPIREISIGHNTIVRYYGDANEDGYIDMGDVVWVERIILGLQSSTAGADANHDGSINMGDVVAIDLIVLGIVSAVPIGDQTPVVKTITITDADLPAPPVSGMTFHFLTPAQGDPGPGKIRVTYLFITYSIWFGVDNNKLWIYHLPKRDAIPASLISYYDSLGIDQYATYTEQDGKYWFNEIPPWINIAKYDPGITTMPVLVSASSTSGQAQISYTTRP
jgi:hypothetical protein